MAENRSRPWSSVPSGNCGSPSASKAGGISEFIRSRLAASNGSCGAISGARMAPAAISSAATRAMMAIGERRKRQARSLSSMRRIGSGPDADARVDRGIEDVDHQVDGDEDEGAEQQVGGHDRDVDIGHRLDEQQAHARPLE